MFLIGLIYSFHNNFRLLHMFEEVHSLPRRNPKHFLFRQSTFTYAYYFLPRIAFNIFRPFILINNLCFIFILYEAGGINSLHRKFSNLSTTRRFVTSIRIVVFVCIHLIYFVLHIHPHEFSPFQYYFVFYFHLQPGGSKSFQAVYQESLRLEILLLSYLFCLLFIH